MRTPSFPPVQSPNFKFVKRFINLVFTFGVVWVQFFLFLLSNHGFNFCLLFSQINWIYNASSQLRRKRQHFLSIPKHQVIQIWSMSSAYFCFSSTQRLNSCPENMLCNALDMPIGGHLKLHILFPKPKITYSICNRSENWMLLNIWAH